VDIEIAHRTATLCNLGNLACILGRKLVWDGEKQEVVGDAVATRLAQPPQRYPYVLLAQARPVSGGPGHAAILAGADRICEPA